MARLLTLDECTIGLRNHLLSSLRSQDEAVLLPQAERVADTGIYKNLVFRLSGNEQNAPYDIFSPDWFSGVSAIRIDPKHADAILKTKESRLEAMQRLKDAIQSETANSDVKIGPGLDCDSNDLDKDDWIAGFDGAGCCVGLYCAEHSSAPETGKKGMNRVHATTYLVCKAGSGLAGATFHSRLMSSLRKGASIEDCLERGNEPGPQALRRVEKAGSRNRSRILLEAAKALGIPLLDSVPDQSSRGKYRSAVTHFDVSVNTIRKLEASSASKVGSTYQYTCAVDGVLSRGLATMSNVSDGILLMLSENGDVNVNLRNEGFSSIPFATRRLISDQSLLKTVVAEHKAAQKHDDWAHIDFHFIRERFVWKNRQFSTSAEADVDLEPLSLWGSHDCEDFVSRFSRELGIASCQFVRLRPALVCLAGMEAGKLRAALRHIKAS